VHGAELTGESHGSGGSTDPGEEMRQSVTMVGQSVAEEAVRCLEAVETHAKSENGDGVARRLPGRNRGEKRREWGGGRGRRARRVGAPAGSGALPAEVDGARRHGAGEEGVRSGGPQLGRCSGPAQRNSKVFDLFKLTSNENNLIRSKVELSQFKIFK
jgi:hypothetical protein